MDKVLLVIPAYNEEKNIEKVVDHLVRDFPELIMWWSMTVPGTAPPAYAGRTDTTFWTCR